MTSSVTSYYGATYNFPSNASINYVLRLVWLGPRCSPRKIKVVFNIRISYKCNRCIIFRGEPRGPCEISLKTLEHDRKMAKIRIRFRFSDVLCIHAYPRRSSITHFVIPAPYTSTCDKIQISKITFIFLIFVRPFQAVRGSTPFKKDIIEAVQKYLSKICLMDAF